jgi:hypothetical protein
MKNLLLTFLAIAVIFAACEKEEESTTTTTPTTPTTTYGFSCKVGGDDFTDNSPDVIIDQNNLLTIHAENGGDEITIRIYNFSDRNIGEEISLKYQSIISCAFVTKDGVEYTNTQSGKLTFTKIDAELSGTFSFTSTSPSIGVNKSVTEGVFEDLTF